MTSHHRSEFDSTQEEPIIRDKRRVDPITGEPREVPSGTDDGAAQAASSSAPAGSEGDVVAELEARQAEVLDLADQLARAKAEVYNTEQRFNTFVKRSRELEAAARETGRTDAVEALIPVLDDIALAKAHGELDGPFLAIADKLEQVLATRFGVERYGVQGEEFDPTLHEALMHQTSPDASATVLAMVAQPGYRRGETVIRPARVGVVGPE